jgi:hypothetical protein
MLLVVLNKMSRLRRMLCKRLTGQGKETQKLRNSGPCPTRFFGGGIYADSSIDVVFLIPAIVYSPYSN